MERTLTIDSPLEGALWAIEQGWRVFPLARLTKKPPKGTRGFHDATDDPAVITAAMKAVGATGYGIVCEGDLVVADVDYPDRLPPELALVDSTFAVQTANEKGDDLPHFHLYLHGSTAQIMTPWGQYRHSANGYIIGPGSQIRRKDGSVGTYEVLSDAPRARVPGVPAESASQTIDVDFSHLDRPQVPDGERDQTLARIAGFVRAHVGLSPEAAFELLKGYVNVVDQPAGDPYTLADVARVVESYDRYEPAAQEKRRRAQEAAASVISIGELADKRFPPVDWVLPNMVATGTLALLVGLPKVRKSWLVLDAALSIAAGDEFLGEPVEQGSVLYLALEDSERRLRYRSGKMRTTEQLRQLGTELMFQLVSDRLPDAIEALDAWYEESSAPRLVIIDTFGDVRHQSEKQFDYFDDAKAVKHLADWAQRTNVAVLVIHHERKAGGEGVTQSASGTTGLTGKADTLLRLVRHTSTTAELSGTGRDTEDFELNISFNAEAHRFERLGDFEWTLEQARTLPAGTPINRDTLQGTQQQQKAAMKAIRDGAPGFKKGAKNVMYRTEEDE